jgi:type IV pilus assembly protein PilE
LDKKMKKHTSGFTLIELLITIAIVAILSAIAIPTYSGYLIRSYRADAQATLNYVNLFMQKVRTEQGSYAPGGTAPTLPAGYQNSPSSGVARYTISLSGVTANGFTVTATPTASISASEVCGNLSLDHTGNKSFSGASDMRTCWGN